MYSQLTAMPDFNICLPGWRAWEIKIYYLSFSNSVKSAAIIALKSFLIQCMPVSLTHPIKSSSKGSRKVRQILPIVYTKVIITTPIAILKQSLLFHPLTYNSCEA